MATKTTPRKIFWIVLLVLPAACAPAQPNIPEIQTKAVAMVQTSIALTQTALPTATPPPITPTATAMFILFTPTPVPPSFIPMTPDSYQVEHWKEYQAELAKVVISSHPESGNFDPAMYKDALCEWDILGQSDQEIYVYAVCGSFNYHAGMRSLAIIYIEPDGSVRKVKVPEIKANSLMHDYDLFPVDVQNKICYYFSPSDLPPSDDRPPCPYRPTDRRPRLDAMYAHLEYRKYHPEEPPLIILSATPTTTPTP